jgi:hypothetical protein
MNKVRSHGVPTADGAQCPPSPSLWMGCRQPKPPPDVRLGLCVVGSLLRPQRRGQLGFLDQGSSRISFVHTTTDESTAPSALSSLRA